MFGQNYHDKDPEKRIEEIEEYICKLRQALQGESVQRVEDFEAFYTKNELDNFFQGEKRGRKQVNYRELTNLPTVDLERFGAVGDGTTDDTAAINEALVALSKQNRGRLLSHPKTYYITDKIDYSVLHTSAQNNNYHIDFAGSLFNWGGSGETPMFYLYCNQNDGLRIFNFILNGNETADVKGIFADSLQATRPTSNFTFSNLEIWACKTGIELGSTTGGQQNAVANFVIEDFLIDCGWETPNEQANDAILFKSTNVDQGTFMNGTIGGKTPIGLHMDRIGSCFFNGIYGNNCDAFVYVDGPHGKLVFIDCGSENGTPPGEIANTSGEWLYFNTADSNNRQHPITFIGCIFNDNSPLQFSCGATGGQKVNFIGCDMDGDITIDSGANNIYLNLIGSHLLTGTTVALGGSAGRLLNIGSGIEGTVTYAGYNARYIDPVELQTPNAIQTETSVVTSFDPDINEYDTFYLTLVGDVTIGNPTPGNQDKDNQLITFIIKQDATGSRAVTWGTDYKENWTPDTSPNAINTITFRKLATDTLVQVAGETDLT